MSKQRARKFVTKILRKTCSLLVKIIPDGENNFTQNKYNKLQKINVNFFFSHICKSANMGSSTVQLHVVCLIDMQTQNLLLKLIFYYIKRMRL